MSGMEAAGLAIGLASFANVIIEDIRYIEVARNFDDGFGAAKARLALAEIRLMRWSCAVKQFDHTLNEESQGQIVGQAVHALHQLDRLVATARGRAGKLDKLESTMTAQGNDQAMLDLGKRLGNLSLEHVPEGSVPDVDEEERKALTTREKLSEWMQNRRHSAPDLGRKLGKMKWAVLGKEPFEELIDSIEKLLDGLEKTMDLLKPLCQNTRAQEMTELGAGLMQQLQSLLREQQEAATAADADKQNGKGNVSNSQRGNNCKVVQGGNLGNVSIG